MDNTIVEKIERVYIIFIATSIKLFDNCTEDIINELNEHVDIFNDERYSEHKKLFLNLQSICKILKEFSISNQIEYNYILSKYLDNNMSNDEFIEFYRKWKESRNNK